MGRSSLHLLLLKSSMLHFTQIELKIGKTYAKAVSLTYISLFKWPIPGLFCFIFICSIHLTVKITFANDWIRTADEWAWKGLSPNWATTTTRGFVRNKLTRNLVRPNLVLEWSEIKLFALQWLKMTRIKSENPETTKIGFLKVNINAGGTREYTLIS